MRYFVWCKTHPQEKIYLKLSNQPLHRRDTEYAAYQIVCPQGIQNYYSRQDIQAEVGLAPYAGMVAGGLLFLVDPLIGVLGAGAGLFGTLADEEKKVKDFNDSWG